ncbi:MAG: GNAT family N-acetyltransferase [Actinomycetota bacterium]|nr:GNAT family N-acetyltransferase [Actinomycetota bacterium]
MAEGIVVRPLESLEDARAASALIDRIWGERRVMGAPLLRAMAAHGGQVLGAFRGEEMLGAQAGLVGIVDGKPVLHSHITGVAPEAQHEGVGFLLKVAQREWCLERGIEVVTWTFDPLVARNARFNLYKLAAVADRFYPDYYGPMNDSFNRGDRSDRLEVRWDLNSERATAAVRGKREEAGVVDGAILLDATDRKPRLDEAVEGPQLLLRIPLDYHELRGRDQGLADAWRTAVRDALELVMGRGYVARGFLRDGTYVLEPE